MVVEVVKLLLALHWCLQQGLSIR